MSSQTYWELLKRPEWQKRRLERLSQAEFCCSVCYDDSQQLHVHHKRYVKGRNPWEYEDFDLAVLCDGCHTYAHQEDNKLKEMLSHLDLDGPFSKQTAMAILAGFFQDRMPTELIEQDIDLSKLSDYSIGYMAEQADKALGFDGPSTFQQRKGA